jgi:hypothetical protein
MLLFKLEKLIRTENGKMILSVLLGLGLASLFRRVCKGKNCSIVKSAPLDEINNKIYKSGNKCYKYDLQHTKCDKSKQTIPFT